MIYTSLRNEFSTQINTQNSWQLRPSKSPYGGLKKSFLIRSRQFESSKFNKEACPYGSVPIHRSRAATEDDHEVGEMAASLSHEKFHNVNVHANPFPIVSSRSANT